MAGRLMTVACISLIAGACASRDPFMEARVARCSGNSAYAAAVLGDRDEVKPAGRNLNLPTIGSAEHESFQKWLANYQPPAEEVDARLGRACYQEDVAILLTGDPHGTINYDGEDGDWDKRLAWRDDRYVYYCAFDARRSLILRSCEVWLRAEWDAMEHEEGSVPWPGAADG